MNVRRTLLPVLFLIHLPTAAAETAPACHEFLTPQECSRHLDQLARLPAGEARASYLAEFALTRKERQTACDCARLTLRSEVSRMALRF